MAEGIDTFMKKKQAVLKYDGSKISYREFKLMGKHVTAEDYIRSGDVQKNLGIALATLRQWHSEGKLGGVKRSNAWHYSREDLMRIINEGQSDTRAGRQ
jgi:hypothetical protein